MRAEIPLTRTDAALLDTIAAWPFGFSISLPKLVENYDFNMRDIPTFDEISYGLARLMARGYITATYSDKRGVRLKRTRAGAALRQAAGRHRRSIFRSRWPRIGEYPTALGDLVGAPRWPAEEVEDRSAGRLPKLTEHDWDLALEEYKRSWDTYFEATDRSVGLVRRYRKGWPHTEEETEPRSKRR